MVLPALSVCLLHLVEEDERMIWLSASRVMFCRPFAFSLGALGKKRGRMITCSPGALVCLSRTIFVAVPDILYALVLSCMLSG